MIFTIRTDPRCFFLEVLKSCVYPRPIALRSEVWEVNLIKGEMGNLDAGIDPGNITKLGLSWYASV